MYLSLHLRESGARPNRVFAGVRERANGQEHNGPAGDASTKHTWKRRGGYAIHRRLLRSCKLHRQDLLHGEKGGTV